MNPSESKPVFLSGQYKITPAHLQRLAYIYVRQSTFKQVRENRESQLYQYHLSETAQALGWSQERIRVIDADLGHSGRESESREGFKELVAEISLGHVGIIFGYEVSRLARNNRDWYHLMDLAAIFGTLLADGDGIYDLKLHNDRLLLGLKGTMSEAELHILRQRLDGGRLTQVKRGEYRQHLPTGLVRQADGSVVKDPDDQVRHVIELVLTKFAELGSCRQVLRYLRREKMLLPRHQTAGLYKGELLWKVPSDAAIYEIICNPAYAGAFAYGRKQKDPTRHDPGRPATGRLKRPLNEWLHLQQGVYPAYISWEQYLANQERLHQNALHYQEQQQQAQGIARSGAALLQGLARCGQCGCVMKLTYRHVHRYHCDSLAKRFGESRCLSAPGPSVDEVVVQAFFEALQPAQLDALEAILKEQQLERHRLAQHWTDRLKRAQYEARLAERQYQLVHRFQKFLG
jgi:DNA invertase Pin-like site-specific DNA recombinase